MLAHELTHVIQQNESIPTQTAQPREANAELKCKVISLNKFGSVPHIQKYGFDVHFTETKNWAKAYFSEEEAETIAREDQNLDTGGSHPTPTSRAVFTNPERNDQYTLHFPSRSVAESGVRNAIQKNRLSTFGRALHRYQDSFSHRFPRGAPYNNISNARHDIATERVKILLARRVGLVDRAQQLFPNTLFGRGAIIRHLNLGNYPDDFNVNGQQRQRDRDMKRGSIAWIEEFHLSRTSP